MNPNFLIFIVVAVVVVAVVLIAYRSGSIDPLGTFEPSDKVEQNFKRHQLPKQYHYYYYRESPTEVFAITGLDRRYAITGEAWRELDPEETTLEKLLAQLTFDGTEPAKGYVLMDPDQSHMGIFYSSLPDPAVQVNAQQQVTFTLDVPSALTDGEE